MGQITDRVYIVEGIGQAWAVNQATGAAAVVCFGAGRMPTVAEALRREHPLSRLVLVPDKGMEIQAFEIARRIKAEWCELPTDKPSNYDANDLMQEHGTDALRDLLEQSRKPPMRYTLLKAAEIVDRPPLRWMVRGVLPAEGIAALYGPSASGKSFLALDLATAIASGTEWFGCRVNQAGVVYAALEGEAGFSQRVKAWQLHHSQDIPDALQFIMQPLDLRTDDVTELADAVTASGSGGLLVIDTLNRAASGADENSSQDMGQLIDAAKALQSKLGGLVMLIHHSGKDATKGLRGHSSLYAALDAAIEVRRDNDRREWCISKSKDGNDSAAHPFRLEVVEIGEHDDGEPITSCVVVPEEATAKIMRRVLPPKSGNQKAIWDALGELFRKTGAAYPLPKDAPKEIPPGRPAARLDDAIAETRTRLIGCEVKRQTERTTAAIQGLVNRGLLVHREGWIWCS